MHPGGRSWAVHFRTARTATEQELKALQSSLKGLKAGNDPIVAIKTLQTQLAPLEKQASAAWRALGVPALRRHVTETTGGAVAARKRTARPGDEWPPDRAGGSADDGSRD